MSTFVAFIDLNKTFDWVDRSLLQYRLLDNDIDGNRYTLIKRMYTKKHRV